MIHRLKKFLLLRLAGLLFTAVSLMPLAGHAADGVINTHNHLPALRFNLTDDNGTAVSQKNYQGQIILLYFGFAGCSQQCPLTLAHVAKILRGRSDVRFLFVSIDPAHDTPSALHNYMAGFASPTLTGLTGDNDAVLSLTRRLRAAYRPGNPSAHGTGLYIFDEQGRARFLVEENAIDTALPGLLKTLKGGS